MSARRRFTDARQERQEIEEKLDVLLRLGNPPDEHFARELVELLEIFDRRLIDLEARRRL